MEATQATAAPPRKVARQEVDSITVRFCGDSGDGMQLTGAEFTRATAVAGNDLQTFPDYPAEIRAPAGTIAGVSGFQIQFSARAVFTSGDQPDVLVAMNPAALKANLADLKKNGALIINTGAFTAHNLTKAGYATNPAEDGSLKGYQLYPIGISRLTQVALAELGLGTKDIDRTKNMYALGIVLWLFARPMEPTLKFIHDKFGHKPQVAKANELALRAGFAYGENTELFHSAFEVKPARIEPGTYRNVSGNEATALGMVAACQLAGLPGFLGSYPITPASDILHELSKLRNYDFTCFQAEDEIAGIGSALGAAYGGVLAFTTTSGPGVALKQETIGLAIMSELPLVIINVQRGGPSTGLPTKTEQADLFQAVLGRNGEAPLPVLAARSPADAFECAVEATRIAVRYMTPVILLTDGYIANGQEPWRVPNAKDLAAIQVKFRTDPKDFKVYARAESTLAREWVRPGTPGLEHRIGGLEKDFTTGNVSYDPANHERMVRIRAEKVAKVAQDYPKLDVAGERQGDVLVVGWGSTYGAITEAVATLQRAGKKISHVHLRHVNPLPNELGEVLRGFKRVMVPELNLGQLSWLLRARYLVDAQSITKIQGKPFRVAELVARLEECFR